MTSQSNLSLIAVGVVSFVTGFYVHQMLKPTSPKRFQLKPTSATTTTKSEDDSEDEEEEEDEGLDINSLALNEIPGEVRMTLVVRQDLLSVLMLHWHYIKKLLILN